MAYRAATLTSLTGTWGANPFVANHTAAVPYVVHCIKSGLDQSEAQEIRDLLVARAPENLLSSSRSTVQTRNCWLTTPAPGVAAS